MAFTQQDFYLKYIGKGVDPDHAYGFQCVDLFNQFCIDAGYPYPLVNGAKDFCDAWKKNLNHLQENFESIAFENKQDGDWLVYGAPHGYLDGKYYGHICMYRKDNGNGTCVVLGQNQGGPNGTANQINLGYNGLLIILRPKMWSKKKTTSTTKTQDKVDQILTINSKVKFGKEYTVSKLNVSQNTVYLKELGIWVKASELTETKNGN